MISQTGSLVVVRVLRLNFDKNDSAWQESDAIAKKNIRRYRRFRRVFVSVKLVILVLRVHMRRRLYEGGS